MTAMLLMVAYMADLATLTTALAVMALGNIELGDTVSWGILAGVFTPLLTSIVQRPTWSKGKRTAWGVVVSIVIGLLTCLTDGTLDQATTVLATVAAVVLAAATAYGNLWKPSGVAGAIENATTPQHAKTL